MKEKKKTGKRSPLLIIGVLLICIGLIGMSVWFLQQSVADIGADKTLRQPQTEQPKQEQPKKDAPKKDPPAESGENPPAKKPNNHRRNFHHRRPHRPSGEKKSES